MKDAYYFPHDSNAKDDPKCVLLIDQLGLEGYGIFWVLLETLRDQPEYRYPLALVSPLARRYNTTAEIMMTVIKCYKLFEIDNKELFFSQSFLNRMEVIDQKREKARKAVQSRWKKYECNTDVLLTNNERNTRKEKNNIEKESKVEKSKENLLHIPIKTTRFYPPSLDEIKTYCIERKNHIDAERFFDFYEAKNWMIGKNKMKNWKAAIRTWEKEEKQKGYIHPAVSYKNLKIENDERF